MEAGSARVLRNTYPGVPELLGAVVQRTPLKKFGVEPWHLHGLATVEVLPGLLVGVFQTKGSWCHSKASLRLIGFSASKLREWALVHPGWEVHTAFPGVGLGRRGEDEVLAVLSRCLSDLLTPVVLYRWRSSPPPVAWRGFSLFCNPPFRGEASSSWEKDATRSLPPHVGKPMVIVDVTRCDADSSPIHMGKSFLAFCSRACERSQDEARVKAPRASSPGRGAFALKHLISLLYTPRGWRCSSATAPASLPTAWRSVEWGPR